MTTFDESADAYKYNELLHARPIEEYDEDMGPKLWWCLKSVKCSTCDGEGAINRHANLPDETCKGCGGQGTVHEAWAGEAPYVGSPLDCGITVEAHVRLISQMDQDHEPEIVRRSLGGWPGYHTHFTEIAIPKVPGK